MSRELAGTVYVSHGDGSYVAVLGGTSEADAKKKVGAETVGKWDDHVWVEASEGGFVAQSPIAVIDDDAPEPETSSHRSRQRGQRSES